jgi:putative ABC transport system ATP-binding protein
MVTHDPVAASHADRVLFLGDGRIVADKPRQSAEEISAYMLASELTAGAPLPSSSAVGHRVVGVTS